MIGELFIIASILSGPASILLMAIIFSELRTIRRALIQIERSALSGPRCLSVDPAGQARGAARASPLPPGGATTRAKPDPIP